MKREYMKPGMREVKLSRRAQVLAGSNDNTRMTVVYEGEENI